jgi:hypothetical protein
LPGWLFTVVKIERPTTGAEQRYDGTLDPERQTVAVAVTLHEWLDATPRWGAHTQRAWLRYVHGLNAQRLPRGSVFLKTVSRSASFIRQGVRLVVRFGPGSSRSIRKARFGEFYQTIFGLTVALANKRGEPEQARIVAE